MGYGSIYGYQVNRKLTEEEKKYHLNPKEKSKSPPMGSLSIIKMNSTFLECVDRFFDDKGFLTTLAGMILGIFAVGAIMMILAFIPSPVGFGGEMPIWGYFVGTVGLVFCWFFGSLLFKLLKWETVGLTAMDKTINKRVKFSAGFTHYPIRFNRKNRKVYVHQLNGKIFVTKWEDIYFTLHKEARAEWVVRGLILDDDGETVLDAFDLPHTDNWVDGRERQTLTIFWEFVRRYMEGDDNDVRKLLPEIGRTMNVSNRKETFWEGYKTMLDNATAGGPLLLILINIPLMFGYSIGRKIAMMCNTIPDWPARIEAECAIEPNDPYLVDETHPPPAL